MIENSALNNPMKHLYQYKFIVAFVFMLFLFAKPILNIPLTYEESKYELDDTSEKENSSKNETLADFEDEINYFYFKGFNNYLNIKQSHTFQLMCLPYLNYNKDIHLPPPRV